jgi:hypothetical protein
VVVRGGMTITSVGLGLDQILHIIDADVIFHQ